MLTKDVKDNASKGTKNSFLHKEVFRADLVRNVNDKTVLVDCVQSEKVVPVLISDSTKRDEFA